MSTHFRGNEEKITLWMIIAGIATVLILMGALIIYFLSSNSNRNFENPETIVGEVGNKEDDFKYVSIDIGKTVNEVEEETKNTEISNEQATNTTNTVNNASTNRVDKNTSKVNATQNKTQEAKKQEEKKDEQTEVTEEIKFCEPLKGEILREFSPDSLVYSETLDEWIIHNGVDIKADKTSVVKAAAEGTVFAIKTDPRYGLTVIIEHSGGYKTVYANLLTAEFVVEGEKIEAGQTIGTVGNSATFEIADECHLHFEMLKDDEYIDPNNFIDF